MTSAEPSFREVHFQPLPGGLHHHHHEISAPVCQECASGGIIYALSQKHRLDAFRLPTADLELSREIEDRARDSCHGDLRSAEETEEEGHLVQAFPAPGKILEQLEMYRGRAKELLDAIADLRGIVERLLTRQSHQFEGTAALVKNAHHLFSSLMDRYMDFRQRLETFQKESRLQQQLYGQGWENVLTRIPGELVDKVNPKVLRRWTRTWEVQFQRIESAGASLQKQFTAMSRNIGVLTPPMNMTPNLEEIVPAHLLDISEHEHRVADLGEDAKCARDGFTERRRSAVPEKKEALQEAEEKESQVWSYLESRIRKHQTETWPAFLRDIAAWQRGIETLFQQHSDQVAPQIQASLCSAMQLRRQVQEFGNQISAYEAMLDEHERNFRGFDLPSTLQSAAEIVERELNRRQFVSVSCVPACL